MSNGVVCGWYHIDENVDTEGHIDLAIRDRRTGELVGVQIDNLEDYNALLTFLQNNRQVGVLKQLKSASN